MNYDQVNNKKMPKQKSVTMKCVTQRSTKSTKFSKNVLKAQENKLINTSTFPAAKKFQMDHRGQTKIPGHFQRSVVAVNINIAQFLEGITDLVTVNGGPFSAVQDSGLRKIIDPILEALNLTVNQKKCQKALVQDWYEMLKEKLEKMVQNRLIRF